MKAIGTLSETRTNMLGLECYGDYNGEYSQEAFSILDGMIDDQKLDDKDFPYGELGWFDIMKDTEGKIYAVYGEDNLYTDSVCYYIEVTFDESIPTQETLDNVGFSQAICESRESEKIVRFMKEGDVTEDFLREWNNGNIWGVYYENGIIVVEKNDGSVEDYNID